VALIIGGDQGEGHGELTQGIRGQQQREGPQVQFIDAES
jgi:hypothetical protein